MPATREELFSYLEKLGVEIRTFEHPPLFTVEQSKKYRGDIPGGHCKNLFLKDKKGALWLIVTLEETAVNLKTLHKTIGSARLSFGKPDLMQDVLGIEPGSVSPFALINDREKHTNVVLDQTMMALELLNYHPLSNEATTSISSADLLAFIKSLGFEPQITLIC